MSAGASSSSASSSARKDNEFFSLQLTAKTDQVRKLLDSRSVKDKLDGMKRITAALSKGKDVSFLFPDVVKNVVSDSLDVKKLVYMYVIRYADVRQDEALLSINSFQRDLQDPAPYIRALALRVMSSIQVPMIAQIVLMAVRKCASDPSAYVRKTAAFAIPKAYRLDPNELPTLQDILVDLLADRSPVVVSAAVRSFSKICPGNFDIIHPVYRKLCRTVADSDEWGQCTILGLLLEYARTQFLSPSVQEVIGQRRMSSKDHFSEDEDNRSEGSFYEPSVGMEALDEDHRLLIRGVQPLLRSRNPAVVLSVASVLFHAAPSSEMENAARALVRILKSSRETQFIVLTNIATIAAQRPSAFRPFVKEFYVRGGEPLYVRKVKLEILTLIATEENVHPILKEFQAYLKDGDKVFVEAAIKCMGRIAANIPDIAKRCFRALLSLIHSRSERVVAESVVVMRQLLQRNPEEHIRVIGKIARLVENVHSPTARASVVWVIGEYGEHIPRIAPDALRLLAKNFSSEDISVKLQIITAGAKLFLKYPDQCDLLFEYILNLARYDVNYDIRDRARLLAHLFDDEETEDAEQEDPIVSFLKMILTTEKPMPTEVSEYELRDRFTIGSLSHLTNHHVKGYRELPDFPEVQPDPSVRNTESKDTGTVFSDDAVGVVDAGRRSRRSRGRSANVDPDDLEAWLDGGQEVDGSYSDSGSSYSGSSSRSRSSSPRSGSYSDRSRSQSPSSRSYSGSDGEYSGSYSSSRSSYTGSSYSYSDEGSVSPQRKKSPPRVRAPKQQMDSLEDFLNA